MRVLRPPPKCTVARCLPTHCTATPPSKFTRSLPQTVTTDDKSQLQVATAAAAIDGASTDLGGGSDNGGSDGGSGGRGKVTAITAYAEGDDNNNNSDDVYNGWNLFKKCARPFPCHLFSASKA